MLKIKSRKMAGFTLMELMIVVAIIGVIVGIGYPNYTQYVVRGKRSEGRTALLDAAARQERYYSDNNQYAALATVGITTTTENGYYTISLQALTNANQNYILRATPTGFTDATCGFLQLTHAGAKTSESGTTCWAK